MKWALLSGCIALGLGGCASTVISIRRVPDQTPAADNAAAVASAKAFADAVAAESAPGSAGEAKAAPEPMPLLSPADAPPMYTYDPWERFNRFTYRFNARFDEAVFLPVANTYRRAPRPIRSGIHNFFGNLAEIDSVINYTLQWRLKYGLRSLERLAINTTIGVGGLFDVATKLKLAGTPTGFATTLAKWGMHPGPYLVIPLLGPSTLRDGIGFGADYGAEYGINPAGLYRGNVSWGLGTLNAVDQRANINFRYYSSGSPFEYETIRFLYVHRRLIEDQGLHSREPVKKPAADAPAGK
ncbi:MAG TPA: VacJ family lipoprotein [Steroidobacteraceae bacterium]|jgi:phospholipid-binding lipoprotein MlaA|nr:VacJ family lipoprotein [Steroidobacteraceae bacterium]